MTQAVLADDEGDTARHWRLVFIQQVVGHMYSHT